jgi:hypothetical protein
MSVLVVGQYICQKNCCCVSRGCVRTPNGIDHFRVEDLALHSHKLFS